MNRNQLKLDANEYIIYEKHDDTVIHEEDHFEFFLTNRNIILIHSINKIFRKTTYNLIKYPLKDIKIIEGETQVRLENNQTSDCFDIVISFNKVEKRIGFNYDSFISKIKVRKEANHVIDQISKVCISHLSESKDQKEVTRGVDISKADLKDKQNTHPILPDNVIKKMIKAGFKDYTIIPFEEDLYIVDYEIQRFATYNDFRFSIFKFSDLSAFVLTRDKKKLTDGSINPVTNGHVLKGALFGRSFANGLAPKILKKTAKRVGLAVGGLSTLATKHSMKKIKQQEIRMYVRYANTQISKTFLNEDELNEHKALIEMFDNIMSSKS